MPPAPGIVHLGLGAFFRAHAAIYLKETMALHGGNWGVIGVSLRSGDVRDRLKDQDNLYTALEISEQGNRPEVIDVISDVLVAPEDPDAVLRAMASPATKIVSLTITEKGYCRVGAGLDLDHPDIVHDLTNSLPRSAVGFIVRALATRRSNGIRPFTVLSLDNLSQNGVLTSRLVTDFAKRINPGLAEWIRAECQFPSTMVDRIVPATTPVLVAGHKMATRTFDPAIVSHEPFRQWVIEDRFVDDDRPEFSSVGAQFVDDVEPFEHMKLRMLNGAHSAIAYLGSLAGFGTVAEAVGNPHMTMFLDRLWEQEIVPSLEAPNGVDLKQYASTLLKRFANPQIEHLLEQIAMDGSQKIPQRILDTLFENIQAGRPYQRLLLVLAGWFRFAQLKTATGSLNDPLAARFVDIFEHASDEQEQIERFLDLKQVFGSYPCDQIKDALHASIQKIRPETVIDTIQEDYP